MKKNKKIENDDEAKYNTFYWNSKGKKLLMKVILNQFIKRLFKTYKRMSQELTATGLEPITT